MNRRLVTAGGEIRGRARRLGQINPAAAGVRSTAMGFEGHGAAIYWSQLVALLPSGMGFKGRVTIQRWTLLERGGHFAALEQPEALAEDIREFFRPLRSTSEVQDDRTRLR